MSSEERSQISDLLSHYSHVPSLTLADLSQLAAVSSARIVKQSDLLFVFVFRPVNLDRQLVVQRSRITPVFMPGALRLLLPTALASVIVTSMFLPSGWRHFTKRPDPTSMLTIHKFLHVRKVSPR